VGEEEVVRKNWLHIRLFKGDMSKTAQKLGENKEGRPLRKEN